MCIQMVSSSLLKLVVRSLPLRCIRCIANRLPSMPARSPSHYQQHGKLCIGCVPENRLLLCHQPQVKELFRDFQLPTTSNERKQQIAYDVIQVRSAVGIVAIVTSLRQPSVCVWEPLRAACSAFVAGCSLWCPVGMVETWRLSWYSKHYGRSATMHVLLPVQHLCTTMYPSQTPAAGTVLHPLCSGLASAATG
jgi:hypothetical protein